MIGEQELRIRFRFYADEPHQMIRGVRGQIAHTAVNLDKWCPDGDEKDKALDHLEKALQCATRAITQAKR